MESNLFRAFFLAAGIWLFLGTVPPEASASDSPSSAPATSDSADESPQDLAVIEETLTVVSASGIEQTLLEAPVPISAVTQEEIELEAGSSSVPKLLESLPGLEGTQAGLFEFKLNTRGLNSAANRRLAVSIDGRDPSFPLIDSQEWATVTFPADDLERVELIRGPSSAMYGTNAFNGVLNLVSRSARDSLGGRIRATAGELDTQRLELRVASALGGGWFFKTTGSYIESDDFYQSRDLSIEYSQHCATSETVDCLLREATPLPLDRSKVSYLGARLEKTWDTGFDLVLEGGHGTSEGVIFSSPASRFQSLDTDRPWARVALTGQHVEISGNYTERDADFWTLLSGTPSYSDSSQLEVSARFHSGFASGRGYGAFGGAWTRDEVTTAGPTGSETLLFMPIDLEAHAVFGQLHYDIRPDLTVQLAARWDDNPLHGTTLSPQASLVWAPSDGQSWRLSYREGFLTPSYPDYFVSSPLGVPVDLSPFESFCNPLGVDCGFGNPVPLLGVGNASLEPETISAVEIGYSVTLGSRSFLQASYYRSEVDDFIQASVPLVGTGLGRANLDFGPYAPPANLDAATASALSSQLEAALGGLFPFLTNPTENEPLLVLFSFANSGTADLQGLELSLDTRFRRGSALSFSYTWTDFESDEPLAGLQPLSSNTPEHTFKAAWTYQGPKWGTSLRYRWSEGFRWFEGLLNGPVPSYDLIDLSARYDFDDAWSLGLQVSNLLDEEHYQFYSGDLLKRQVLLHVDFDW